MESEHIICQQLPAAHHSLRIAVVTETWPPEINGVAITAKRMVDGLRARQHEIQLVRPRQGRHDSALSAPRFEEVLKQGLSIPRYENLKMGLPAKQALLRQWVLNRPDIVHIVTEGPLGFSAQAAALKLRIPCSTDFHTNFHSYSRHYGIGWLRKPISGYLRRFHNRAHCTLVPTNSLRALLEQQGFLNLQVVTRGVDTQLFTPARRSETLRKQWGVDATQPVALYVGRLAPEKNLPLLVKAYTAMQAAVPAARLLLVGDGPERSALQAQHPQIIFAGMQSGEALAAHYASADLFLFPSTTETFGNVTLEAMASGLAVAAYDYAAAAEHIRHGGNGLLAGFDNTREFINLAVRLAANPARARTLGAAARITAQALSWDCMHAALENTLRAVIAGQQRAGGDQDRLSA
jgi:glycosyltransferase involved in cell wall biosynthesis